MAAARAIGTEHVGAASLFPVGEVGPGDGLGGDGVHRAPSCVVWRRAERATWPDEGSSAVRGVHLVGREDDEVEVTGIVVGPHVDRAMRGELGGVDEDAAAGGMDLLRQLVHGLHDSGDVGRAGDGEQGDATGVLSEATIEIVDIQRAVRTDTDVHRAEARSPRQVVRVVFEHGRQHHGIASRPATPGRAC